MVTFAVKARLKALRKRFHLGEFRKSKGSARRRVKRMVANMPRRGFRRSRSRGRSRGMNMLKPLVIGFLGGTLGTGVTGNKLGGAGVGAAAQAVTGSKDIKSLALAGVAGYFGHDVAVMAQNTLSGVTGSGSGGYL